MSELTEHALLRGEPQRSWCTSAEDSQMRCYLGMIRGRITIAELLAHFASNYPHVDPMTVSINFPTVAWDEPPTADEVAARKAAAARHAERKEKWERETYARLKAKFDGEAQGV